MPAIILAVEPATNSVVSTLRAASRYTMFPVQLSMVILVPVTYNPLLNVQSVNVMLDAVLFKTTLSLNVTLLHMILEVFIFTSALITLFSMVMFSSSFIEFEMVLPLRTESCPRFNDSIVLLINVELVIVVLSNLLLIIVTFCEAKLTAPVKLLSFIIKFLRRTSTP